MADEDSTKVEEPDIPPDAGDAGAPPDPTPPVDFGSEFGDEYKGLGPEDVARKLYNNVQYAEHRAKQAHEEAIRREQMFRTSPEWQEYENYAREKKSKAEKQEEPKFWEVEAPDLALLQKYTVTNPETGKAELGPSTPAEVRAQFEKWTSAFDRFENERARNPYGVYEKFVDHRAQQIAQKMLDEKFAERDERDFCNQFEHVHANWLFEQDQSGQPLYDQNMRPVFSAWGTKFMAMGAEAARMGIQRRSDQIKYAYQKLYPELAKAFTKPDAQETPAEKRDKKNADFQKAAAAKSVNRSGSFANGKRAANAKESFEDQMRKELAAVGIN